MQFSERLDIGCFSHFAKEIEDHNAKPLRAFWYGRLAQHWSLIDQPVNYGEFVCMTLYRRPGHLVSPDALQQLQKVGIHKMTSMSAG